MRSEEARAIIEPICTLAGLNMPHVKLCSECGGVIVKSPKIPLYHNNWVRRSVCGRKCHSARVGRRSAVDFEIARQTRRIIVEKEYY